MWVTLRPVEGRSQVLRRRVLAVALMAAALAGGAAVRAAADPGPNGHNDFGLCKAYFAGSATGQAHKQSAPPFQALQQAASDMNESVEQYCSSTTPGGK